MAVQIQLGLHRSSEYRFAAMGTAAHIVVVGGPDGLVRSAVRRVDQLESRWSRFRPDSDVSALNAAGGCAVVVSADTVTLVRRAVEAWRLSNGACDPTVLRSLEQNGYVVSFDQLDGESIGTRPVEPAPGCAGFEVDEHRRTVRLPPGVGFDPGGIGKGLAADIVASELIAAGADGALVNIGGDLRAIGCAPDPQGWTVLITETTVSPQPIASLTFDAGAVATSVTTRRTWSVDGDGMHHLIDPLTGHPMDTDVVLATAYAASGWLAEAVTKATLLGTKVSDELAAVPSLIVHRDGSTECLLGMEDLLS